jgi:hypothetical protein
MTLFVKRYHHPGLAIAARENYHWLSSLDSGVVLPELVSAQPSCLIFSRLGGREPTVEDLPGLAAVIGRMHRAAAPALEGARLDRPHAATWPALPSFTQPRRAALRQAGGRSAERPVEDVLAYAAGLPPAFYKDSNLRNFLVTGRGIAVVDFDDLTLAPHGYDLAKLIVSMAMTFGRLSPERVGAALDGYNSAVGHIACAPADLVLWAELNWLLTADYMGRNGYTHPWPQVRPWTDPLT